MKSLHGVVPLRCRDWWCRMASCAPATGWLPSPWRLPQPLPVTLPWLHGWMSPRHQVAKSGKKEMLIEVLKKQRRDKLLIFQFLHILSSNEIILAVNRTKSWNLYTQLLPVHLSGSQETCRLPAWAPQRCWSNRGLCREREEILWYANTDKTT